MPLPFLELAPIFADGQPAPDAPTLEIRGADGRCLLRVGPPPEYHWTIEPEDAPEAARIFMESIRSHYRGI